MNIQRAERGPNGRIDGVAPPVLEMKVVGRMSLDNRLKLMSLREQQSAIRERIVKLIASLGLDPGKQYRFDKNGDIIEIGAYQARY